MFNILLSDSAILKEGAHKD